MGMAQVVMTLTTEELACLREQWAESACKGCFSADEMKAIREQYELRVKQVEAERDEAEWKLQLAHAKLRSLEPRPAHPAALHGVMPDATPAHGTRAGTLPAPVAPPPPRPVVVAQSRDVTQPRAPMPRPDDVTQPRYKLPARPTGRDAVAALARSPIGPPANHNKPTPAATPAAQRPRSAPPPLPARATTPLPLRAAPEPAPATASAPRRVSTLIGVPTRAAGNN